MAKMHLSRNVAVSGLVLMVFAGLAQGLKQSADLTTQGAESVHSWYTAQGGSPGADTAYGIANDGDRRVIVGQITGDAHEVNTNNPEFVWSDDTDIRNLDSTNTFAASIYGQDDIEIDGGMRQCNLREGSNERVCDAKSSLWFDINFTPTTPTAKIPSVAVPSGGSAVTLMTRCSIPNSQSVKSMSNNGWETVIQATRARVHKEGWFANSDTTSANEQFGKYQNEAADLTLLDAQATNNRYYLLFKYTGNIKIGKLDSFGALKDVKTIQADGTYINICSSSDPRDVRMVGKTTMTYTASGATTGVVTDIWCKKTGYLLVALNLHNGNLIWAMPIVGQADVLTSVLGAASKFDEAYYFKSPFSDRVVFGSVETFEKSSVVTAYTPSTTSFVPPLLPDIAEPQVNTQYASGYSVLARINAVGTVQASPLVFKTTADDAQARTWTATAVSTTDNTRIYHRNTGTWDMMRADDRSDMLYLAGTWAPTSAATVSSTATLAQRSSKLWLGNADYDQVQIDVEKGAAAGTTPTPVYLSSYEFVAGFTGSQLSSGSSFASFLLQGATTSTKDINTITHMAASGGQVYVLGTFQNATFHSDNKYGTAKTKLILADTITASSGSYFLLKMDGKTGAYVDGATMSSTGVSISGLVASPSQRAFIFGTFSAPIHLDYQTTSKMGASVLYPRTSGTNDFFQLTFGDSAPSGRKDDRALRLGLGIGLGLGLGLIIVAVVVVVLMRRGGGRGGGKVIGDP